MATKNVIYNQTVFEACLWCYGTIIKINDFLLENDFAADEILVQGQEIIFDETQGNETIKDLYNQNNIIPVRAYDVPAPLATIIAAPITAPILEITENNKSSKFVVYNQTVFDACLWCYGTIKKINDFLLENDFAADEILVQGQEIIFEETQGDKRIKSLYVKNDIIPNSVILKEIPTFEFMNGETFEFMNGEIFKFMKI